MLKSAAYIKILLWVTLFAVAMAYLESAIVVYLRALIYPGGFGFPLVMVDSRIIITEVLREVATIIMLFAVSIITGRYFTEKFAWFIYCFGVWDIFYYVFLKLILGWPESLMTWDVLFFVPVTWVGPVITPIIASLTMILLAGFIIFFSAYNVRITIKGREWVLLIAGSLILFAAWSWDYSAFIFTQISETGIMQFSNSDALFDFAMRYVPKSFNWILFWTGELAILAGTALIFFRYRKELLNLTIKN
jgi:hypothetical protein